MAGGARGNRRGVLRHIVFVMAQLRHWVTRQHSGEPTGTVFCVTYSCNKEIRLVRISKSFASQSLRLCVSTAEAQRRPHTLRRRGDVRPAVRVRPHSGVPVRGVVRQRVAARLHTAQRPRGVLLQAARTTQPSHLLGPHARAQRNVRRLHDNGADGMSASHSASVASRAGE